MLKSAQILVISEVQATSDAVSFALLAAGHRVDCVSSPLNALEALHQGIVADLILIDTARDTSRDYLFLPAFIQVVGNARLCVLSTGEKTPSVEYATKWNIKMLLHAPYSQQDVSSVLQCSLGLVGTSRHHSLTVPYHLEELDNKRFFLAASPAMMRIYQEIRLVATVDVPVLILGESGVGKENVAMLLHKYHARCDKKLLNVNCAALPNDLLESELFGYEAGAFTGAMKPKPGLFETADQGTLLLDEIGEMSPQMQAKLLHVLQDGSFCRLGGRSPSRVDVRVLAATNINMQSAIAEKRFREDLFYRLNTLTITIPPLRERREEIPFLMEQLFKRGAVEFGRSVECTPRIVEAAQDYHWPGNLRELRNFVARLLILRDEESSYAFLRAQTKSALAETRPMLCAESAVALPAPAPGMKDAVTVVKNETEIRMLQRALLASGWNRRRAATNLNISYRSLLYKIQQHGLRAESTL